MPDASLPQELPKHLRESDVAFEHASYLCGLCRDARNFANRDGEGADSDDPSEEEEEEEEPKAPEVVRRPTDEKPAVGAIDALGAKGMEWRAFAEYLEAQIKGVRDELRTLKKRRNESKKKRDDRKRLAAARRLRIAQSAAAEEEEVRGRSRRRVRATLSFRRACRCSCSPPTSKRCWSKSGASARRPSRRRARLRCSIAM